jgi:uncharacterized protein YeaO (DUF488 family)
MEWESWLTGYGRAVSRKRPHTNGAKIWRPAMRFVEGFKHDPAKWSEFRRKYRKELSGRMAAFCDPASISIRNEKDDGESNLADDFLV